MLIRHARPDDCPQIARLYYATVRQVNARHYTPVQIRAWAPEVYPAAYWRRRQGQYLAVFVAESAGVITGFTELEPDGGIDCFYVHHAWQGCGVGSRLLARLVAEARRRRLPRLYADVSLTAQPFFRRQGFRVVRRQTRYYRHQFFRQFFMEKRL